jgi:hypothetical protein
MWCVPIVAGYIPVMIEERLGAHTPYVENARVNRVPSVARRSRFGVCAYESP